MAIYLDLGDEAAARDVSAGTPQNVASSRLLLSLYRGDWRAAGLAAYDKEAWSYNVFENWGASEALRDYALKTGELDKAIRFLQEKYALSADSSVPLLLDNFRQAVFLSQLLEAQGHTSQALELRRAASRWNDANELKYGSVFARRLRAGLLLLEGKREAALGELAESFRSLDYMQWWYTIKIDPLWVPMHQEPEFRAIATDVQRHVSGQRAELEVLRRRGDIPQRPAVRPQVSAMEISQGGEHPVSGN